MNKVKDVIYVDSNDQVLGSGSIDKYIKMKVAVRISRVLLFDGDMILLQQRSGKMVASKFKWDQTSAGHVDVDEDYKKAALRELEEEMGIIASDLQEIAYFYTEDVHPDGLRKRFNKLYVAKYEDSPITIDRNEVKEAKWVHVDEVANWLKNRPKDFTSTFSQTYYCFVKWKKDCGST